MQYNFKKMFSLSQIIAFEIVSRISLIYDENTSDGQAKCYQTVLTFPIWVTEIFSNSIFPRLMENWDKSAAVQVSAVLATREHVDSWRVF